MNILHHKGYHARIVFDAEDEIFTGRLSGINDQISFHASTVQELKMAFIEAVEDYLETCARVGKSPEKPYSGKVMFRIAPDLHAQAALAAELSGISLNQWAAQALQVAALKSLEQSSTPR
jgi:predicted HicB family RNase H-like nuclease